MATEIPTGIVWTLTPLTASPGSYRITATDYDRNVTNLIDFHGVEAETLANKAFILLKPQEKKPATFIKAKPIPGRENLAPPKAVDKVNVGT